jgi:DNA-binding MarR family transcriptional regulator/GNAT superfamily N-acetyltransferase
MSCRKNLLDGDNQIIDYDNMDMVRGNTDTITRDQLDRAGAEAERIRQVRRFNRFFTTQMGLLDQGLLQTRFSLTEARVIFELAQRDATEVSDIRRSLGLDAGHLSRVLARFDSAGLARREPSPTDGRRQIVRLTSAGRDVFATLDARSNQQAARLLEGLGEEERRRLLHAFATITSLLGGEAVPRAYIIRALRPGDLGWVVQRHGVLYAEEYGWDQTFEALVARIVAAYGENPDPAGASAWIAEADGVPVGCVFCTRKDQATAQLRLLLVDPSARGHGLGSRLVEECVRFARAAGYQKLTLWTNDVLAAARHIYVKAGFRLVDEEPHQSFGHRLVGQNWELDL